MKRFAIACVCMAVGVSACGSSGDDTQDASTGAAAAKAKPSGDPSKDKLAQVA